MIGSERVCNNTHSVRSVVTMNHRQETVESNVRLDTTGYFGDESFRKSLGYDTDKANL